MAQFIEVKVHARSCEEILSGDEPPSMPHRLAWVRADDVVWVQQGRNGFVVYLRIDRQIPCIGDAEGFVRCLEGYMGPVKDGE